MVIAARVAPFIARSVSRVAPTVPFAGADEAWFWTMAALAARRDGLRSRPSGTIARPCEPDDVVTCLDRLYRSGRIDLLQARVLRIWGERQRAPSLHCEAEQEDAGLWRKALEQLTWPLRLKGIVA